MVEITNISKTIEGIIKISKKFLGLIVKNGLYNILRKIIHTTNTIEIDAMMFFALSFSCFNISNRYFSIIVTSHTEVK